MGGQNTENKFLREREGGNRWSRFRQWPDESLGDFYERFQSELMAREAAGCDDLTEQQAAMDFLLKLDRNRYQGLRDELENAESCGRNEYPISLNAAYNIANKRKGDVPAISAGQQWKTRAAFSVTEAAEPKKIAAEQQKAEVSRRPNPEYLATAECWYCKKLGHYKQDCKVRKADNAKRLKTKAEAALVTCVMQEEAEYEPNLVTKDFIFEANFCTVAADPSPAVTLTTTLFGRFDVLCDSQSSVHIFKEKELLTNIRPARRNIHLVGIGGTMSVTMVGDYSWIGEVYC
jgi:hypothetical protein